MINVLLIRMAKRRPMCPLPSKVALHETNPEQKVSLCQTMQCTANCTVRPAEENNALIVSRSALQCTEIRANQSILNNDMQYKPELGKCHVEGGEGQLLHRLQLKFHCGGQTIRCTVISLQKAKLCYSLSTQRAKLQVNTVTALRGQYFATVIVH